MGLYLHVPFCLHKCPYCSFYSLSGRPDLVKRYVEAVKRQIIRLTDTAETGRYPLTTVFFGGGTPSMLAPAILSDLLQTCLEKNTCSNEAEISVEVNPATIDTEGLIILRRAGFNRLSIGIQSLNDRELKLLGRAHTADDAIRIAGAARQAGFSNIGIDLMYGLPTQNAQSWRNTLHRTLELAPEHLSLYELTIEEGTPFANRINEGTLQTPHEDLILSMMDITRKSIATTRLARYEISNYALPGFRCRHNLNYWHNGSYIGLGPGAVSCVQGTRYSAVSDVEQFCTLLENGFDPWIRKETLDREASFRETVILGLRLTEGVSLQALYQRFGIDAESYYNTTLQRLLASKLVNLKGDRLRLTEQGLLLANMVMADLV